MIARELVEASAGGRVLVFGSLPPAGRDLDLLVRPPDATAIAGALAAAGFEGRDGVWARFAGCSVEVVELVLSTTWGLDEAAVDALFSASLPLDGAVHLARPAPHHALLILARRVAAAGGALDDKRRERLEAALAEDRDAWAGAWAEAGAWHSRAALELLRSTADGRGPARALRDEATREHRARLAPRSARERLGRLRARVADRRRGPVVALSGLDGAGKSSQAAALREVLETLGYDVTVAWTRVAWDDWVWSLAVPLKRWLAGPLRAIPDDAGRADSQPLATPPDPVRSLRERSDLLTNAWVTVLAFANGSSHRRLVSRRARQGCAVICDRYTLDSIVELRYAYGRHRRLRLQRVVVAALSPRPKRAYLLDVTPATAFSRKGEWGLEWLERHRELYLEERERVGVRLVDGEQPRERICEEIARDLWASGI